MQDIRKIENNLSFTVEIGFLPHVCGLDGGHNCSEHTAIVNMKYRIDKNKDQQPTIGSIVIQASDTITTESIFTLYIEHVLACRGHAVGRGFIPAVKNNRSTAGNGEVSFGENRIAYNQALTEGRKLLRRLVDELENLGPT